MFDVTIIGCGVIGALLARKLSQYDLRILILERENDVAMGTTKANSAIVHAGYDPEPGTLMSKLNVQGSEQMEKLCRELDVEYRRCGSMVLAFSAEETATLKTLYDRGIKNGVKELRLLSGEEARTMEPALAETVRGALLAPTAAIVDPWGLCLAAAETAVRNGAELKRGSAVARCGGSGRSLCGSHGPPEITRAAIWSTAQVFMAIKSAPWSERANGCLNTHAESTICWISPAAIWSTM